MRTHYTANNPFLKAALRLVDGLLSRLRRPPRRPAAVAPRRILVCNQAHLGDAILATAVLPALHAAHPGAEIGMLVHPDAARVAQAHPGIRHVHTVEHWHLNRRGEGLWARLRRHGRSSREAQRTNRLAAYDLAIDLYHYFPNSIPLLRRCGIPCIAGWDSGGFGPLLDVVAPNGPGPMPVLERHAALLARIGVRSAEALRPNLPQSATAGAAWAALASARGLSSPYIALHLGAHAEHRRWPAAHWSSLARALIARGHAVVLLGHGPAEIALCRQVGQDCPSAIDLSGQLDWSGMLSAISQCALLVGHDSAPIHVAAAYQRQRICLAAGINDLRVWLRAEPRSVVLMHPVPCAPCGRTGGCATMYCLRRVTPSDVLDAFDGLWPGTRPIAQGEPTEARP